MISTTELLYKKMLAQLEDILNIKLRGQTLEEKAVNFYCLYFGTINENLREGIYNIHIEFINAALDKIPPFEGISYRGIRVEDLDPIEERYKPGNIITEKAFTSSSELREVAEKFAGMIIDLRMPNDRRLPVIFKIHSKTGKSISKISGGLGRQKEILFKPNSRFLVLNFEEKEDYTEIELEQV